MLGRCWGDTGEMLGRCWGSGRVTRVDSGNPNDRTTRCVRPSQAVGQPTGRPVDRPLSPSSPAPIPVVSCVAWLQTPSMERCMPGYGVHNDRDPDHPGVVSPTTYRAKMRYSSLFSGAGALDYGLELVSVAYEGVAVRWRFSPGLRVVVRNCMKIPIRSRAHSGLRRLARPLENLTRQVTSFCFFASRIQAPDRYVPHHP